MSETSGLMPSRDRAVCEVSIANSESHKFPDQEFDNEPWSLLAAGPSMTTSHRRPASCYQSQHCVFEKQSAMMSFCSEYRGDLTEKSEDGNIQGRVNTGPSTTILHRRHGNQGPETKGLGTL
jgi:hypothetical protein